MTLLACLGGRLLGSGLLHGLLGRLLLWEESTLRLCMGVRGSPQLSTLLLPPRQNPRPRPNSTDPAAPQPHLELLAQLEGGLDADQLARDCQALELLGQSLLKAGGHFVVGADVLGDRGG